jgi:BirA family biotin operon repressor/biotin-[acetyl-CoA-carboxylase] ligase
VRIRRGNADDLERLRQIAADAKAHWGYARARVDAWVNGPEFWSCPADELEIYVAETGGRTVAWASLAPRDEIGWLEDLWVEPRAMGGGVGSSLFRHAAERARELGATRMEWEAEPNAIGFYEKMGGRYVRDGEPSSWGRTLAVMGVDLGSPPMDSLAPDTVEPLLGGRFGRRYRYEETCKSTQELLEADDPEGAVAVCEEQQAGRGRLGRRWEAPRGKAILCSVLLRPPHDERLPQLSLVGGVAVADAVEAALGLAAQIKWPNDVLVNRKKVAGVLAEARSGSVVVGIGINVNQERSDLPAETAIPPASLYTTDGVVRDRAPILARVLERLEHHYERWREGGLDAVYVDLGSRDFLRGRKVSVDGVAGRAIAIDRAGRLEIDTGAGHKTIDSGEVSYER